jgi:UDP-3-O-[3-hydroxymyristoyl] glucosamine N-acyltransferase
LFFQSDNVRCYLEEPMKSATLQELAKLVSGTVSGDSQLKITGLNSLELAGEGEVSFIVSEKMKDALGQTKASACIVPQGLAEVELPVIRVTNPDLAAAVIHNFLLEEAFTAGGIHPNAVIGQDCFLSAEITIKDQVSIGNRVTIGDRVTIYPGVVIGDDVVIGNDCTLHANVVVAYGCVLGNRVVLHHGAIIGSDGFGFASDPATGEHVSKPQVGNVSLDDGVQVGANSCVDRAAFGTTRVKAGARIDNLVMVGHNCVIGENSILVGQVGIAGSTTLGRNVVLGARAGIAGHIHLDDGAMVAAMGGVHSDLPKGAVVGGIPAFDIKKWGRSTAAYTRLPDMVREMRKLRKEVDRLTALLAEKKQEGEKE